MRKLLMILLALSAACLLHAGDYRIVSTRNGRDMSLAQLARALKSYDVIFFGEIHDDAEIHEMQRLLLGLLHRRVPRLIVSFEMFERDTQQWMDSYLAGEIGEEEFLHQARPWGNYETDYKPLVEYAKANRLPVLTANIPRQYASRVVRFGTNSLDELSPEERAYIAQEISAHPGSYRDRFLETMQINTAHGMPGDANTLDRLYYAQCMKDDTMAESIVLALGERRRHKLIHFNGDFHSRAGLGTVERVKSRNPRLKIAVITPEFTDDVAGFRMTRDLRQEGDFLIIKRHFGGG
ncbi:MAG: ABC transporter permease [Candidatus Cloacimonetes bacterium HGW-Cloacimonetes-2]|jgi:uncharacterized iron-regulated protein|nr:MAG: ABC transporter permease [Candidatus Cloacimonetes bacterium HGW-Cloacimonetes-2]